MSTPGPLDGWHRLVKYHQQDAEKGYLARGSLTVVAR
jgi:hypothetical protein